MKCLVRLINSGYYETESKYLIMLTNYKFISYSKVLSDNHIQWATFHMMFEDPGFFQVSTSPASGAVPYLETSYELHAAI